MCAKLVSVVPVARTIARETYLKTTWLNIYWVSFVNRCINFNDYVSSLSCFLSTDNTNSP